MILKIGHRGAQGYAPGNTLLSIKKAMEFDLDYIEFDVARCKTGEIIAIHDSTIDRTTNSKGFVSEMTFEEIRSLSTGHGQKIPTLQEALDLIDKKTKVNIEIKGEGAARAVLGIIETYVKEKGWQHEDFLISSFNHHELQAIHRLNQAVKIGAVVAGIPIGYAECAAQLHAYSIHISKEFINKKFVDDAHRRGLKVFVYTLNDDDYIHKMKGLGIDGLFTDFPDRL